jgi:hypothetical protein
MVINQLTADNIIQHDDHNNDDDNEDENGFEANHRIAFEQYNME